MDLIMNTSEQEWKMDKSIMVPPPRVKEQQEDSSYCSLLLYEISLTATPIIYQELLKKVIEKEKSNVTRPVLTLPQRLTDPLYGRIELDDWLRETASGAPTIEEIWRITEKLPSLTEMLLKERDCE